MFREAETFESFETKIIRVIRLYTMVGADEQVYEVELASGTENEVTVSQWG